jgi:hypothetical protein
MVGEPYSMGAVQHAAGDVSRVRLEEHEVGAVRHPLPQHLLLGGNAVGGVLSAILLESVSVLRPSRRAAIVCAGVWRSRSGFSRSRGATEWPWRFSWWAASSTSRSRRWRRHSSSSWRPRRSRAHGHGRCAGGGDRRAVVAHAERSLPRRSFGDFARARESSRGMIAIHQRPSRDGLRLTQAVVDRSGTWQPGPVDSSNTRGDTV